MSIYICVCRCIYVHRCSNNVFDEALSVRSLRAVGGQESFVGLSTGLIESQFCVMLGPAAAGTRLATTACAGASSNCRTSWPSSLTVTDPFRQPTAPRLTGLFMLLTWFWKSLV